MKSFADLFPLLLLCIAKVLPRGARAEVQAVDREQAGPVIPVDHILRVDFRRRTLYVHCEFVARYRSNVRTAMARIGGVVCANPEKPTDSVLFILNPKGTPRSVPEFGTFVNRGLTQTYHYKVIKMWEQDPDVVLDSADPAALTIVPLLRTTLEQLREASRRLSEVTDERLRKELQVAFVTFAGIRYDRGDVERIRKEMWDVEEILMESSVTRPILQKAKTAARREGRKEGLQEGRQVGIQEGRREGQQKGLREGRMKGRIEEARHMLKRSLANRFPGLENRPELDTLSNLDQIETLFDTVITARQRTKVLEAIRDAAS